MRLCGVIVEVEETSGKALRLSRVNETFVDGSDLSLARSSPVPSRFVVNPGGFES